MLYLKVLNSEYEIKDYIDSTTGNTPLNMEVSITLNTPYNYLETIVNDFKSATEFFITDAASVLVTYPILNLIILRSYHESQEGDKFLINIRMQYSI